MTNEKFSTDKRLSFEIFIEDVQRLVLARNEFEREG